MTDPARHRVTLHPGGTWADLAPRLRELLEDRCDLLVATSGSSGTPKQVLLSGAAVRASGEATAAVLGGHGRWVLALPTHHVAGLQVLARSVLAGTEPVAVRPGASFTPAAFTAAVARLGPDDRGLCSLVPTQLIRLLGDPDATAALARLHAVLVGGAAGDPGVLARAREQGVPVVTTYGMTETAGGCVYDGVPLPGVAVRVDDTGRVHLSGPVLARGYPLDPTLEADRFVTRHGRRWYVTDDRGRWDGTRLRVLGRVDDVITTGGHKVDPGDVEAALRRVPGVADALVVGVPDPEWGEQVCALVHPAAVTGAPVLDPAAVRVELARLLPRHAVPRRVLTVTAIPVLDTGKPDRHRARELLAGSGRMGH